MRTINYSLRVILNFHWLQESACETAGKQVWRWDRGLLHAETWVQSRPRAWYTGSSCQASTPLTTEEAALGGAGALCQPAMSSQRQGAQSMNLQGPLQSLHGLLHCVAKSKAGPGPMFFQLCRHTDEPGGYCSAGHVFPCWETETISSGIVRWEEEWEAHSQHVFKMVLKGRAVFPTWMSPRKAVLSCA